MSSPPEVITFNCLKPILLVLTPPTHVYMFVLLQHEFDFAALGFVSLLPTREEEDLDFLYPHTTLMLPSQIPFL